MSSDDISLASNDWAVAVSPQHGGRLARVDYRGRALLHDAIDRSAENTLLWGCYPMAPWAGRLRNATFEYDHERFEVQSDDGPHALHGFVCRMPWTVTKVDATSIEMAVELSGVAPFDGWCTHRIVVDDLGVHLALTVTSHGRRFPVVIGWHPWFLRAWTHDIDFDSMLARDADNIVSTVEVAPTQGPWDDCFVNPRRAPTLRNGDTVITLDSDCNYWMVYTEPSHAFCLEPMSGPPNSLDTSHPRRRVVTPSQPLTRTLTIREAGTGAT